MAISRRCSFCQQPATITDNDITESYSYFKDRADDCWYYITVFTLSCPSPDCGKTEIRIEKNPKKEEVWRPDLNVVLNEWILEPQANIKIFPDYIPPQILQDYKEAKLILSLSPKASATLSRRCLQSMIRDFWCITGMKSLHHEIEEIKNKIDTDMYDAIMSLKSIGNIGAHPEKDINIIIDVEPDEANELAWLIETLIEDWYIARNDRQNRINKIKSINTEKQLERNSNP